MIKRSRALIIAALPKRSPARARDRPATWAGWESRRSAGGSPRRLRFRVVIAVDNRPDFLATDADIREGAVIERHQLAISALPLPPARDRRARRNKEVH